MLVVFSLIFVVDIKIIFDYNFGVPLSFDYMLQRRFTRPNIFLRK